MNRKRNLPRGFLAGSFVRMLGVASAVTTAGFLFPQPSHGRTFQPASVVAQAGQADVQAESLSPATIRRIQHSLMQGGYAIDAADGVWGSRTIAALREFQKVKGLQATGRADAQTLAALGVADAAGQPEPRRQQEMSAVDKAPPVRARTPADLDRATILAVQRALDKQGLQVGPADGVWGEQTVSAIGNFQRARGMPASGQLDAHTLAALGLLPGGSERPAPRRAGEALGPGDLDPAAIRMIQQTLDQRGFKVGTPDGVWGDRTVRALRDFQRAQGIEPLGEPDVYTLAALGLLPGETRPSGAGTRNPR
jgi:peptidoglycan hydrolase-like protein with peptidoglycan-binding domain